MGEHRSKNVTPTTFKSGNKQRNEFKSKIKNRLIGL